MHMRSFNFELIKLLSAAVGGAPITIHTSLTNHLTKMSWMLVFYGQNCLSCEKISISQTQTAASFSMIEGKWASFPWIDSTPNWDDERSNNVQKY